MLLIDWCYHKCYLDPKFCISFNLRTIIAHLKVLLFVGKRAFIAGVADDNGYGWAIAKSLAAAGAEILVGTWVPVSKYKHSSNVCLQTLHGFPYLVISFMFLSI